MIPEPIEQDVPKVVAMRVAEGKVVVLGDLPFDRLVAIAKGHDCNPFLLMNSPLHEAGGAAADALYRACCDLAKVQAPETLTVKELWDAVHMVEDPTAGGPKTS